MVAFGVRTGKRKGMMRTRRVTKQARVTHTRLHTQEQQINSQPKQKTQKASQATHATPMLM
jgi:hypothetical protein